MELADGTKTMNVTVKRGDVEVTLKIVNGRYVKTVLKDALFIPSYPQDIFSVKAATSNGAELKFQRGHNELVHRDGTTFAIEEHGQLYYLNTVEPYYNTNDKVSVSHDNTNNAWQHRFLALLTEAMQYSDQAKLKTATVVSDLPNSSTLVAFLKGIQETVKCGRLYLESKREFLPPITTKRGDHCGQFAGLFV